MPKQTISTSVIDFATTFSGKTAILYYDGSDYSWLPNQDSNFKYGTFVVECTPTAKKITASSWNGKKMATKIYGDGAWQDWVSWVSSSDLTPVAMTTTRTENPYISTTAFNRIVAKKIGPNLLWVLFNTNVDLTPFPNGGNDFIEIGKVNGISSVPFGTLFDIPAQNGSGTILLDFSDNGVFKIVNQSGKPVSGFVRTSFVAVANFS